MPMPPEAVPVFETCWAVLTALSVVPPDREHLLRPLTRWLTERGRAVERARVRAGPRRDAPVRRDRDGGAGAVRHRALADAGEPAAAGRRDPRRRGPGGRLRGAEGVHAVDLGVERDRDAGRLAAAALDGVGGGHRAAGGRHAGGAPGRGGAAPVALRAGRGGRAVGTTGSRRDGDRDAPRAHERPRGVDAGRRTGAARRRVRRPLLRRGLVPRARRDARTGAREGATWSPTAPWSCAG